MIHGDFAKFSESTAQDPFTLQNKKLLKVFMQYGPVMARTGSMVAYQGDVRFTNKGSGGISKMLKAAGTGEGVSAMECTGTGELFLADRAKDIQVMYLDNDMILCNGASVLAFSASIEFDITRVSGGGGMASMVAGAMAGGFWQVSLRGTGYVALTTAGEPIVFDVAQAPTFADSDAVVMWTHGVAMQPKVDSGGMKSVLRGGTGELLQLAFSGQGWVMVQPAENVPVGAGKV